MKKFYTLLVFLALVMPSFGEIIVAKSMKYGEETFIDEDRIWLYETKNGIEGYPAVYRINRFSGTQEIAGKTYHKLYQAKEGGFSADDVDVAKIGIEDMTLEAYIRQEGQSYYMLRAYDTHLSYGSTGIEAQIYNFDPEVKEWHISTSMDGDAFPEGFEWSVLPFYGDIGGNNITRFRVEGWKTVDNMGSPLEVQELMEYKSSPLFGALYAGPLYNPGAEEPCDQFAAAANLVYVRDLAGNYLYRRAQPSGAGSVYGDAPEWKLTCDGNTLKVASAESSLEACIYYVDGKALRRFIMEGNAADISTLSPGVYFITVASDGKAKRFKFVKY